MGARYQLSIIRNEETGTSECFYVEKTLAEKQHEELCSFFYDTNMFAAASEEMTI
ncbi:hypothetical protein ACJX0J_021323, partial [Zea mays]